MPTPTGSGHARLPGDVVVAADAESAARRLAAALASEIGRRLSDIRVFHLALSGGSSAKLLCEALRDPALLARSAWDKLHLWLVDERCVSAEDPNLNHNLLREVLFSRVPLPPDQVHPMPVDDASGDARYEAELRATIPSTSHTGVPILDAVVLGMGPDGHTASLFPRTPALDETRRLVVFNDGDAVAPPRPRMTMTFPLLVQARRVALLVTGESKKSALDNVLAHPDDVHALPVCGLRRIDRSRLAWYLDRAACPPRIADDEAATSLSG